MASNFRFIETATGERDKRWFFFRGYLYKRYAINNESIYVCCIDSPDCPAKGVVKNGFMTRTTNHTHLNILHRNQAKAQEVYNELKIAAQTSRYEIGSIYDDVIATVS